MAAEITSFEAWSATPGSNQPDDTDTASNLAENLRTIQAEVKEWLASAGTLDFTSSTDLSTVGSNYIAVSGTATVVTSFGILAAGIEKTLYFNAGHTLTHNATSLILPTGADIVCVAGDVGKFVSLGSGNWRCTNFIRGTGRPLLNGPISGLGAADAANTIANTDYAQIWNWKVTTASKTALTIGETTASTGASAGLLEVGTLAASTAIPFTVKALGTTVHYISKDGDIFDLPKYGESYYLNYTTGVTSGSGAAGDVNIYAQESSNNNGGDINITSGGSYNSGNIVLKASNGSAAGGSVTLTAGNTTTGTAGGGVIALTGGASAGGDGGSIGIYGGTGGAGVGDQGGNITITSGGGNDAGRITLNTYDGSGGPDDSTSLGIISLVQYNGSSAPQGLLILPEARCVSHQGDVPTLQDNANSTPGSGATIDGTKNGFVITLGTSAGTQIRVTLQGSASILTNNPIAIAQYVPVTSGTYRDAYISGGDDTYVQITLGSAGTAADKINVIVFNYE